MSEGRGREAHIALATWIYLVLIDPAPPAIFPVLYSYSVLYNIRIRFSTLTVGECVAAQL